MNNIAPLESFIPVHLLCLMREGYVVWFYDNYRSRREMTKEGEQYWIENGELHTKTVRMYKSKDVTKGDDAAIHFRRDLKSYTDAEVEYVVGEQRLFRFGGISRDEITMHQLFRVNLSLPCLPLTHSYYDLIDDMTCRKALSFHKRKIAKIDAFDAKKSKIVVFGWLLKKYPNSVIIPEFGIGGGGWSKSSIVDMAAFDTKRMIFVEIKAENDTYARVGKQLEISAKNADEVWLAIYDAKTAPKEIHENVGILSLSSNGKTKVLRKAKSYKHEGGWMGHIWSTEWQDSYRSIKGASKWLQHQREGHEGFCNLAASILGKKARQFTIDMWRARHQREFLWRRDQFLDGDIEKAHIKRGQGNGYDYYEHCKTKYEDQSYRLCSPALIDFVKFGFMFPAIEKRPVVKSWKQQILERKAEADKLKTSKDESEL